MSIREEAFKGIVRNAIDFFEESIKMVYEKPKISLINFYSATELFFKARLINEHWAFIVKNMDKANSDKFRQGHSKTIGIDIAIDRLDKIFNEKISDSAKECFENLKKHRNQIIHFYHEDFHNDISDKEDMIKIISEQCKGWYYLYKIINHEWKEIFVDYIEELKSLDELMKENRKYLIAKFNDLENEIKGKLTGGKTIIDCPSCGLKAFEANDLLGPKKRFTCLVCDMSETVLYLECPDCTEDNIYIRELGNGKCENCGYKINMDEIIDIYSENILRNDFVNDEPAYCKFCEFITEEGEGSVVYIEEVNKYLCLNCYEEYDVHEIDNCRHCNEKIAGYKNIVETGLIGCVMCDGHREWNK